MLFFKFIQFYCLSFFLLYVVKATKLIHAKKVDSHTNMQLIKNVRIYYYKSIFLKIKIICKFNTLQG